MIKSPSINLALVNITVLFLVFILFFTTSCKELDNSCNRYSYSSSYNCQDSLSSFNLSLYARVSLMCNNNSLPVIIIVTTPLGVQYTDTLKFPITERGVEVKKVESGIWQDYEWSYRKNILFNNKGKWTFTIIQDTSVALLKGVGQMGIKVSELVPQNR